MMITNCNAWLLNPLMLFHNLIIFNESTYPLSFAPKHHPAVSLTVFLLFEQALRDPSEPVRLEGLRAIGVMVELLDPENKVMS
jgi:hypothetical protein